VRVLVVEADGPEWRAVHQDQRVTRLGEGQAAAGRLLDDPMRRTAEMVAAFVRAARGAGAGVIRVVATSAVREAPNRAQFTDLVRQVAGQPVDVVSGEEEARLTLLGVAAGLPDLRGTFLLFDIGGGSTEFVAAEHGRPVASVSLRLGVVALTERFTDQGPVDAERFALLRAAAGAALDALPPSLAAVGPSPLVGTAGTVTTLAALDLGLGAYDAARVQGHVLARDAVLAQGERMRALPVAERARVPCLEPGRADVLVPGIAICLTVMERFGRQSLVVSDHGLREGILRDMLATAA